MNKEFLEELVSMFLAFRRRSTDINVLEWKFENGDLYLKIEDLEDGLVEIHKVECRMVGFAASLTAGNVETA